jgi:hypothetical protein
MRLAALRVRPAIVLAVALAWAMTAVSAGPREGTLAVTAARTGRALGAGGARRGGSMPDSVLARIGARREVTLAAFQEAWRQVAPPARPDSVTPEGARRFLELLAGKEALGEIALREAPAWLPEDSARYRATIDQLTLRAALDSALAATRAALAAAGDTTADERALGVAARDSAVARMRPEWDEAALARMLDAFRALPRPSRDSGVMANLRMLGSLPRVDAADSARVLARGADGPFRVSDLLGAWSRLNPLERPRVETVEQVRELVENGLLERTLRREAAARDLERRPGIAAALAREREFLFVQRVVAREVYARIALDSLALRRWYQEHAAKWDLPVRVRVLRLVLGARDGATELALRLRDAAEGESLAVRARRRGTEYEQDLVAARDSALFARALAAGPGTVLGPDSTTAGWQVVRVGAVLPARRRGFEEVRALVQQDRFSREGERLMQDLLARARREVGVRVNERALAGLVSRGIPAAP